MTDALWVGQETGQGMSIDASQYRAKIIRAARAINSSLDDQVVGRLDMFDMFAVSRALVFLNGIGWTTFWFD